MAGNLTENDVHVWYCHCDDPQVSARQDQYMSLLADDEIARYKRFAFEKDRRLFLVARALLRTTLSRYATVAPDAWQFEQTDKGKPFLPPNANVLPLQFNVSHSLQVAACAVTLGRCVGVDVESTTRRADAKVAGHFLSPNELSLFLEAEDETKRDLFYRYWTLKESYAKALGIGLTLRFTEFSFALHDQAPPTIALDTSAHNPASHWQFHQQMLAPHYCLAVAVQCPTAERPNFTVRCEPPCLA